MASLYQQYKDEPRKALEVMFQEKGHTYLYMGKGPGLFVYKGLRGIDGVSYGSYGYVFLKELETRQYDVWWADYTPAIRYTDVVFDPKTRTHISINEAQIHGV